MLADPSAKRRSSRRDLLVEDKRLASATTFSFCWVRTVV